MPTKNTGTVTTLFSIPQAVRGPFTADAPFVSGSLTSPSGITEMQIQFNIIEADLEDPTKTFDIQMIRESDGAEWEGFNWQGGSPGKDGVTFVNPNTIFDALPAGQTFHMRIVIPIAITAGVTVTGF